MSSGCNACWAKRMAPRLGVEWGKPRFYPERLAEPLRRRKPTTYFVSSRSDLFHEAVGIEKIAEVFNIMASATPDCGKNHKHEEECWCGDPHTFLLLTKRPARMMQMIEQIPNYVGERWPGDCVLPTVMEAGEWPLPNVWLGVSCEDQQTADERIPILKATPAAHRWVSVEPCLSLVVLARYLGSGKLHGVVAGCESGAKRRRAPWDWFEHMAAECGAFGIPFYLKQGAEFRCGSGKVIHFDPKPGELAWRR